MKTTIKKAVAREFLIVLGIVFCTTVVYLFIVFRSQYVIERISSIEVDVEFETLRKDSLLSDSSAIHPHEFGQWETIIKNDPLKILKPPPPPPPAKYKVIDAKLYAEINSTKSDEFVPPEVIEQQSVSGWTPPADAKLVIQDSFDTLQRNLPGRPAGCCEIIEQYKPFSSSPDISNDFIAFKQARINLIALHRGLMIEALHYKRDSVFYNKYYRFDSFTNDLNKDLLSRLHSGWTGKSKEFWPICDIPENFNSFCMSIGIDSVRYQLITNSRAETLSADIIACETQIESLQVEKGELESSSFRYIDKIDATLNVLLILLTIAYGIRGIWYMTMWSVRTLRETNSNNNKTR